VAKLYRFSASLKSNFNTYIHPIVILDTLNNIHKGISTKKAIDIAIEKYQMTYNTFKLDKSFVT